MLPCQDKYIKQDWGNAYQANGFSPRSYLTLIDRNSLWDGENIRRGRLCVNVNIGAGCWQSFRTKNMQCAYISCGAADGLIEVLCQPKGLLWCAPWSFRRGSKFWPPTMYPSNIGFKGVIGIDVVIWWDLFRRIIIRWQPVDLRRSIKTFSKFKKEPISRTEGIFTEKRSHLKSPANPLQKRVLVGQPASGEILFRACSFLP